jgi:hypothetical protein
LTDVSQREPDITDATTDFFAQLGGRGHEPLLRKAKGTVRFELADGKRVDRWFVTVDKGDLTVSRKNVAADCTLRADKPLFDGIATGEVNAMAAVLRGAMAIEGNPELLVLFQRLFPSRPTRPAQGTRAKSRRRKQ